MKYSLNILLTFLLVSLTPLSVNAQSTILHKFVYTNQSITESAIILDNNLDMNAYNERGFTALHEAVVRENIKLAKELILNGADINSRIKTSIPWHKNTHYDCAETALHLAVRTKNFTLVAMLIKLGANTSLSNNQNETARMLAEKLGYTRIAALFRGY